MVTVVQINLGYAVQPSLCRVTSSAIITSRSNNYTVTGNDPAIFSELSKAAGAY